MVILAQAFWHSIAYNFIQMNAQFEFFFCSCSQGLHCINLKQNRTVPAIQASMWVYCREQAGNQNLLPTIKLLKVKKNYYSVQEKGKMEAADPIAKKKKSLFLPLHVEYSDLMIIALPRFCASECYFPLFTGKVMESSLKHTNRISSLYYQQHRSGIIFRKFYSVGSFASGKEFCSVWTHVKS